MIVTLEYHNPETEDYRKAEIEAELVGPFRALGSWRLLKNDGLAVPPEQADALAELLGITADQVERAAREEEGMDAI